MLKLEKKEWYNKSEILQIYPIGLTTYKQRIKKINTPQLSGYTRMVRQSLNESNLKMIEKREIHREVLNELFGDVRVPDLRNIPNVIKWVNNTTWSWFGDVIPSKSFPSELKAKMDYLIRQLNKKRGSSKVLLFYSIEKNTKDNYFHSHFLIKDESCNLCREVIMECLELISEKNTSKETRIYLKPYDYSNHGTNGSNYTLKNFQYGYDILK
jgi:hypothetical protein